MSKNLAKINFIFHKRFFSRYWNKWGYRFFFNNFFMSTKHFSNKLSVKMSRVYTPPSIQGSISQLLPFSGILNRYLSIQKYSINGSEMAVRWWRRSEIGMRRTHFFKVKKWKIHIPLLIYVMGHFLNMT